MNNDWRTNIEQHLHMMTIKANTSHFLFNALLSCNMIITIIYLLGDYIICSIFLNENYNNTVRQLPIKIQFPFEIQQSPKFEFIAVIIFIHTLLQVWTNTIVMIGFYFGNLYCYICCFQFLLIFIQQRFIQTYKNNVVA